MSDQTREKTVRNIPTDKNVAAVQAERATERWLGGYYVVDHSPCGVANLPNTYGDTWGWMNNRPDWHKRNFVYADGNVWASDFQSGSDYYSANHLPAGFDGIDSVVIGYIATHGVTSGSTFTLSAGSTDHGGCTISSSQMSFGENELRYMFFSTCQSVQKVDPGDVWFGAANGIRAIFGYHTNIIDSDKYGRYFYENWKKDDAITTYAFLDASWRISHDQDPVAAWFGPDEAAAVNFRDTETHFQLGAISSNWIAWRAYEKHSLVESIRIMRFPQMTIHFASPPTETDVARFLGVLAPTCSSTVTKTTTSDSNISYTTQDNTSLIVNTNSGSFDLTLGAFWSCKSKVQFTDSDAVSIATDFVRDIGKKLSALQIAVDGVSSALAPTEIRHTIAGCTDLAKANSEKSLTHVTVVFRSSINGVNTIGTGGVLEITLNGDKTICRIRSVLRKIGTVVVENTDDDVAALQQKAEQRALSEIQSQPFVSDCRVVKSEFGFYSADESVRQDTSELSFRIVVEMTSGQFSRLFEKIYTARDLKQVND